MTANNTHVIQDVEPGLAEGLGSENTQPGPAMIHEIEPDSLIFGLGAPDSQSDAGDPGHVVFDHTHDADESGLPVGLGSENSQDGPAMVHPDEGDSLEFGLGSAETQHVHAE